MTAETSAQLGFPSVALLALLILMFVLMCLCHFLGWRLPSAFWLRSNKEEKIELSATKLFHANGYMLHSGSDFLLSTSGSFKRFDTVDTKEECRLAAAALQHQQQQPQSMQPASTPPWNLAQQQEAIPPQPLRPAPQVPGGGGGSFGHAKTVSFSFQRLDETTCRLAAQELAAGKMAGTGLVSCMRTATKVHNGTVVPQPLDAPPATAMRLTATGAAATPLTAIPRPMAKRSVSLQNGQTGSAQNGAARPAGGKVLLMRRNSSTNPFLCEAPVMEESPSAAEEQTVSFHNNPFFDSSAGNGSATNGGPAPDMDSVSQAQCQRTRSRSESGEAFAELDLKVLSTAKLVNTASGGLLKMPNRVTNPFTELTHHLKGSHMLQKTISEDFLLRKISLHTNGNGSAGAGIGAGAGVGAGSRLGRRSMLRQNSTQSLGGGLRDTSLCSLDRVGIDCGSISSINLEHAISCESVNAERSSRFPNTPSPAQTYTQITGYLCVGLQYDKNSITAEGMELGVSVLEAKGLMCPPSFTVASLDTFVRIFLVPDQAAPMHTKVFQNSATPNYNETFNFWLKKQQRRHSLWFHLYHNGDTHTLIGEAEMEIGEMPRPITTWIPISDSRKCNAQWGELMFSLSYLPTAERLTIVVVKARNLKQQVCISSTPQPQQVQRVFVKVYLMNNDKKVLKKRTSLKQRSDCGTIFNEAMMFSVPPHSLTTVQLRLTVFAIVGDGDGVVTLMGHVVAGSFSTGKGLRHWHQMLSSLRKPVAMWHVLSRAVNQPIFTGGPEAVVEALQSNGARKRNSVF